MTTLASTVDHNNAKRNWWLSAPALISIVIFGILPLLVILVYSFLKPAPYGGVVWKFSTEAYSSFLFQRDIFVSA